MFQFDVISAGRWHGNIAADSAADALALAVRRYGLSAECIQVELASE